MYGQIRRYRYLTLGILSRYQTDLDKIDSNFPSTEYFSLCERN